VSFEVFCLTDPVERSAVLHLVLAKTDHRGNRVVGSEQMVLPFRVVGHPTLFEWEAEQSVRSLEHDALQVEAVGLVRVG
jgi:hypothetical protein